MELKDKLNLIWKFSFLAVFTYAVMSLTCCKSNSSACCSKSGQTPPCQLSKQTAKQPCGANCTKPCCAK